MYLIYWKWAVAKAVAKLCDFQKIPYQIADDQDKIENFDDFEAIIPSPGIPGNHRIYQTNKIIAELDFAFQFLPKNFEIITITGTDGKSTTTWIIYEILQKFLANSNEKIFISGNFEIPFSATILEILEKNYNSGKIIVEISSFMSHFIGKNFFQIPAFSPDYTIFTNLKTDHLNWHKDLQEYLDAKINLVKNTKKKSILNSEILDFANQNFLKINKNEKIIFFGNEKNFVENEKIFIEKKEILSLAETNFSGIHNAKNILSILLVLKEMWINLEEIKKFWKEIKWLPHRLENIGKYSKVTVIEDSKSTSAQSLEACLTSFGNEKNLLLIVWGSDKWDNFEHLEKLFEKRVKKLVCIWATKQKFSQIAQKINLEFLETDDLDEAVKWLYSKSEEWDYLILSPGCASFGLFIDYLDRAKKFRKAVEENII